MFEIITKSHGYKGVVKTLTRSESKALQAVRDAREVPGVTVSYRRIW